jgi:hypothetical protein
LKPLENLFNVLIWHLSDHGTGMVDSIYMDTPLKSQVLAGKLQPMQVEGMILGEVVE